MSLCLGLLGGVRIWATPEVPLLDQAKSEARATPADAGGAAGGGRAGPAVTSDAAGAGPSVWSGPSARTGSSGAALTPGKGEREAVARPWVFVTRPGQFEVIAWEGGEVQRALTCAESTWRELAEPLQLPAAFTRAVTVRILPGEPKPGAAPYVLAPELGGRVTLWLAAKADDAILRQALVHALLLRLAIHVHGTGTAAGIPRWLVFGAVTWVRTREEPASFVDWQDRTTALRPPPLETLLTWSGSPAQEEEYRLAAFWLFTHLQVEAGPKKERWRRWLRAALQGEDGRAALQREYGVGWQDAQGRSCWWQTSFHELRRVRVLPVWRQSESEEATAAWGRWRVWQDGQERAWTPEELWRWRQVDWVKVELSRRAQEIYARLNTLHIYSRNTAISLGRMYEAALTREKGAEARFFTAARQFEQDQRVARDLVLEEQVKREEAQQAAGKTSPAQEARVSE